MSAAALRERAGHFGPDTVRCAVDPAATTPALAQDFECLFSSALNALEAMTDMATDPAAPPEVREPWFAMLYTMRQARTAWVHLYGRVNGAEQ